MEDLITNAYALFDDRNAGNSNSYPPLPPTPQDEDASPPKLGTKYTCTSFLQEPNSSSEGVHSNDFMPPLPSETGHSIHPSRRPNLNSPEFRADELPVPPIRSPKEIAFSASNLSGSTVSASNMSESLTVVGNENLSPTAEPSPDNRYSTVTIDSYVSAPSSPSETANASTEGLQTPRRSQEVLISPKSPPT